MIAITLENMEFYAKIVFVNGSTLGSTFVLLNSTSEAHPNGLGNGSGHLGHNLMDIISDAVQKELLKVLRINTLTGEEQMVFTFQDTKILKMIKGITCVALDIRVPQAEATGIKK